MADAAGDSNELLSATDPHCVKRSVMTTDPTGDSCTVDRSARILVGVCIGAQMAGVDAAAAALAGQDSMSENG